MRIERKDIFNSKTPLENQLNRTLYAFISKGQPYTIPPTFENFVLDGYAGNANIYSVIRKIVDPVIGVTWELMDSATGEPAKDQTMMALLKQPNPAQKQNSFIDEALVWRLTTGNRYIYWLAPLNGPNAGKPAEMHLLPAQYTEIIAGSIFEPVQGYKVLSGHSYIDIPAAQVVHGKKTQLKFDTAGAQLYGMSPLEAALKIMATTNTAYDQLVKNFENGGPDVIITNTDTGAGALEYTKEQRDSIWETFVNRFRNKSKERFMIKNKPVEVHEIGKSVVDLNVIEFLKLSLRDYCNIYNVDAKLLNSTESSTYNNVKEATTALWNNAVIPELEYLKEDLNRVVEVYNRVTNQALYFDFDLSNIPELRRDLSATIGALQNAWWLTPNERREALDHEPMEDPNMDLIYTTVGMEPMGETPDADKTGTDTETESTGAAKFYQNKPNAY